MDYISKMYGINQEYIFLYFARMGVLCKKKDSSYILTEFGEKFGYIDENQVFYWNVDACHRYFQKIKSAIMIMSKICFDLYHITHINNLQSIFQGGYLFAHNSRHKYTDISNIDVNILRSRAEPIFARPIHDYVPLYFNPRNAMLYSVQKRFGDDIVIFEFDNDLVLNPYTIFSYENAASSGAKFVCDIDEWFNLTDVEWGVAHFTNGESMEYVNEYSIFSFIYADDWNSDDAINNNIKSRMMSECLIYKNISIDYVRHIHCKTKRVADLVEEILDRLSVKINGVIYYDSDLFF